MREIAAKAACLFLSVAVTMFVLLPMLLAYGATRSNPSVGKGLERVIDWTDAKVDAIEAWGLGR
jgi:hypothetical protein